MQVISHFLKEYFLDWSLVCGQINTGAWHSINSEHDKWQAVMTVVMNTMTAALWIFLVVIPGFCKIHIWFKRMADNWHAEI